MERKQSRKEILQSGSVDIRVKRAGVFQILTFTLEREQTPAGPVPYLVLDKFLDTPELLRIAEELQLPVKAKNGKFFPPGKMSVDFVGL
jgi:hypothetical protein